MIPSFASSIGGSFILSLDLNKASVDKRVLVIGHGEEIIDNYSPKCRWLVVDIY